MLAGAKSSQSLCLGISNKETINIHGVIQLWAALAKIHTTSLHFKHISSSDLLELETVSIIRNIIMSTTRACSIMYIERESLSNLPGGGTVVFRRSGGEGDSCRQISSLLVLVLTLLGRDCGELRTSSAPPQQRRL